MSPSSNLSNDCSPALRRGGGDSLCQSDEEEEKEEQEEREESSDEEEDRLRLISGGNVGVVGWVV